MEAGQSRCGGTIDGANHAVECAASSRTILRRKQRQHTLHCLKSSMQFAVAAKAARGGRRFTGTQAVLATDLEAFRNSLFATSECGIAGGKATLQQSGVKNKDTYLPEGGTGVGSWSPIADNGGWWWNCGEGTWMPDHGHTHKDVGGVHLDKSLALEKKTLHRESCTGKDGAAGKSQAVVLKEEDSAQKSCTSSAEANNEASSGAPPSGMLPLGGQAKFVQLREVAALCAVRPKHRAFFRRWLACELHRAHKDRQSHAHGYSLSNRESNVATLMLRLSQPVQQASEVHRLSTDKEAIFGAPPSGTLPLGGQAKVAVLSEDDAAETVNDKEAKPEVSEKASGTVLPAVQVSASGKARRQSTSEHLDSCKPQIKSGLPLSLQKLEDARAADMHEGATSFSSLLAGRA